MDKEKIQQFFKEFNDLQEKFGVRLLPDCEEVYDYDWDEEPYLSGIESHLMIYNHDTTKKLAQIDWENELFFMEDDYKI